ncbi:MAG: hypothetical protein OXF02_06755 [Simkaniaceae bacterium]|nr:hypothetical protein [Simkaniaceae bacterium]
MPGQTIDETLSDAVSGKEGEEVFEREKGSREGKDRLTITISNETLERAEDAVFRTRGMTLIGLVERGIETAIEEPAKGRVLRDEKTEKVIKGKNDPFPRRLEELRSGRPVS